MFNFTLSRRDSRSLAGLDRGQRGTHWRIRTILHSAGVCPCLRSLREAEGQGLEVKDPCLSSSRGNISILKGHLTIFIERDCYAVARPQVGEQLLTMAGQGYFGIGALSPFPDRQPWGERARLQRFLGGTCTWFHTRKGLVNSKG